MKYFILRNFSEEPGTEEYIDFSDPKVIKYLTDSQKRLLLEDEREKARKNSKKIVSHHANLQAKEGRERGKKAGTKWGAGIGGALGGIAGALVPKNKKALGALAGVAAGGLLGAGLGRVTGAANGEESGRRAGTAHGQRRAKELGHTPDDNLLRNSRYLDNLERKGKGKKKKTDHWEEDSRNLLKAEKEEARREAARRRAEELERRRVAAEEAKAEAAERDSWTNRYRYNDERRSRGDSDLWWL